MRTTARAAGADWKPVDKADFDLKGPVVEKDADAEVLFWEVRMADEIDAGAPRTVLSHYIRIKVFTERGRESQSKIDIAFGKNEQIKDIAARTIKPNGETIELKKADIFERTIVKLSGIKIKAKSFALPGVEPGSIIEYRWREVRDESIMYYERLQFQRDIPVQLVKYYIKPLAAPGFAMRYQTFHGQNAEFVKEKNGFYSTTMRNMPALHEEPRMPPEDEVRTWTLLFYTVADYERNPDKFWAKHGKLIYDKTKKYLKVTDQIQQAANAAIGDATTPEQKLERLYNFCKTRIKNTGDDASGMSDEERDKLKENKTPTDTLTRGMGSTADIDLLFAALATAAGFEARVVNSARRDDIFFDKNFASSYFIETYNIAVRILTHEGRAFAVASEAYGTDGGKVRDMRAWLIRSSGDVKRYGKDQTVDVVSDPNDVYDEPRVKIISAVNEADVGMVFGYQATSESRALFPQDEWDFQRCLVSVNACLPTLLSRYELTLPAGWRASGIMFNHEKLEPSATGTTYAWQLINLPPIEPEPASPEVTNLAPRLAVSYFPAQTGSLRSFADWIDVSRWYSELSDPQSAPDDALAARAQQLTASAKTELERIQAIARYVQGLQYISVQIGMGRFRPHPAAEVFAKSYGDCKDKANLMRAMLRAVKVQAYPVLIYAGDRTYVREEWASPAQFNHCIIAIKVSDKTQAPTVVQHPTLGRLLMFDATDESTLVGDLPDHEQGSLALVAAGAAGSLLRMPVTPPEANRLERQAEVVLTPEGSITASVREKSVGQSAVNERRYFRGLSHPDYVKMIERWITRGATGATVSKINPVDNSANASFALDVEFAAPSYAQLMQNRLLVFKPAIVSRRESLFLTEAKRTHAVVLESHAYNETVKVKLPDGFDVDELPDPIKLDTPFGIYATTYGVKEGQLIFTRTLVQRAVTIPVEDYQKVRSFYEQIRAAEQSPVVLARK